jgi:hypothetical protein
MDLNNFIKIKIYFIMNKKTQKKKIYKKKSLKKKRNINKIVIKNKWDYVIIGAGVTGVITAEQLYERHPNSTILIIEYDNDIGGCLRSYKRKYPISKYDNYKSRRAIEYGGMRYFEDIMPNVKAYVKKYEKKNGLPGVTHFKTNITSNNNLILSNGNISKISELDNSYSKNVSNIALEYIKEHIKNKLQLTTTGEELIIDLLKHNYIIYNDKLLSEKNVVALLVPNEISNISWLKYALKTGYKGLIESEISSATGIYLIIDLDASQQDVLKEGFQELLKVILKRKKAIYHKSNIIPNKGINILLNTNAININNKKNELFTSKGKIYGKQFIYTIPPKYMSKLMKNSILNKVNDELENGFVYYKACKIVLYYDEPWWDKSLIGRNLTDTVIGQLWIIDDVTLMIYCTMNKATYWMDILNFDINSDNGKQIVINKKIYNNKIPLWISKKLMPLIYEIIPDETKYKKSQYIKSYGYSLWYDTVPLWRSRSYKKYGSIIDRRNLLRFPFGSKRKDHIYVTNGLSMRQGWVEGSIEEAYEGLKLLNL